MKATTRRGARIARLVFFVGCAGALFAQSGWFRGSASDSWGLTRSIPTATIAERPRANTPPAAPHHATVAAETSGRADFGQALNDTIFGRGKFFAYGARAHDVSFALFEQNDLATEHSSWFVAPPRASFESLGSGSATHSSYSAMRSAVAPPGGVITPDTPPAPNAIWNGSGGTIVTPTSGNWSDAANWSPNAVPTSSDTTILQFGGSSSTAYVSTNDLNPFTFNTISLISTASVTETINGNTLQLPAGATGAVGTISQNGSGAFEIQNNITANPNTVAFRSTLQLTADATTGTGTVTLSGLLSDGSFSHKLEVTKDGPNTVVLTGANTYSGGTTVNGGTLLVNNTTGSGTGAGAINVYNGGTLGGTGTVTVLPVEGQAQVNIYNGTVAPGNGPASIGTLTLNDSRTLFDASAKLLIDLSGATSDLLSTTGQLSINSGATIDFNQLSALTASSYQLATYSSWNGTQFTPVNLPANYELIYGSQSLVLSEVPEPSTWAAGALALLAVGYTQRRRFRRSAANA